LIARTGRERSANVAWIFMNARMALTLGGQQEDQNTTTVGPSAVNCFVLTVRPFRSLTVQDGTCFHGDSSAVSAAHRTAETNRTQHVVKPGLMTGLFMRGSFCVGEKRADLFPQFFLVARQVAGMNGMDLAAFFDDNECRHVGCGKFLLQVLVLVDDDDERLFF